jgi:hypothetical protein
VAVSAKKLFNFVPTYENSSPESKMTTVDLYILNLGTLSFLYSAFSSFKDTLEWSKHGAVFDDKQQLPGKAYNASTLAAAFNENLLFYDPTVDAIVQYGGIGPTGMHAREEEIVAWF